MPTWWYFLIPVFVALIVEFFIVRKKQSQQ